MKLPRPSLSPRRWAHNWKLKLAALGLALLLWGAVTAEQVRTAWLPVEVPVDVSVQAPGYVQVAGPMPERVRVRVTGPLRELLEMALNRPRVVLQIREPLEEPFYVLTPQMVTRPAGVTETNAIEVDPSIVEVVLRRVGSREVPVRVRIDSASARGFVLDGPVAVEPPTVRVTGAANRVQEIDSLFTVPFQLPEDDTAFDGSVALDTADLGDVRLGTREVRVRGTFQRRAERTIPAVPVAPPTPGRVIDPETVELRIEGAERVVSAIDPRTLVARIRRDSLLAGVPLDAFEAPLTIEGLPPGVRATITPGRVRVAPYAVPDQFPEPSGEPAAPDIEPPLARPDSGR